MNDLQTSMLLIGGSIILAMIIWNVWQDRKAKAQGQLPNVSDGHDPLLGGSSRIEPTGQFNALVQQAFVDSAQQYALDRELSRETMDDLFGQVFLWFDPPRMTDELLGSLASLSRIGSRPVHMHVTLSGQEDEGWVPLAHGQSVTNLRLCVQLANRKGGISALEYSGFITQVQTLADQWASHIELPDMEKLVEQAQRLDRQAAALDAMFGLHCVLPETADVAAIESRLEGAGWVREGRHWSKGIGAEHLASVVIHAAPGKRVLSFNLDLPNCCDPFRALNEIAEFGNELATAFAGSLMDDAGRELTANSFITIRNQMQERASGLHEAGFSPGSLPARLLFS